MMDEAASLTNPSYKKTSVALYLWWALNIGIVIFVFLAFLMSTLSYTHSKDLANQVNNSFITQQGGLIQRNYPIAPSFTIQRGSVVSFCGPDNRDICEGLGPRWHVPFSPAETWSPAIWGVFAAMNPSSSVYVYVVEADPTHLRATYIDHTASGTPASKGTASFPQTGAVFGVHAHNTSTPNVGVALYVSNNETYLQVFSTNPTTGTVQWAPQPLQLFNIHDPNQNGTAIRNLLVAENYIIVTHGYNLAGATFQFFTYDASVPNTFLRSLPPKVGTYGITVIDVIASHYLGNGYFIESNANQAFLGKVTFGGASPQIDSVGSADFFVNFNTLQIHGIGTPGATQGGQLIFVGTQIAFVDQPITLSMFVEWKWSGPPVLTVHPPTNLLGNLEHEPYFSQVSLCYEAPSPTEPYGGIFFSYIEARSQRAKLVRARPVWTDNNLHLLPSPALDISAHKYGRFRSWLVPTLRCNIATSPAHVLIAVQDFLPVFNTYTWHGGYRYAGLAQTNGNAGDSISVVRAGISEGYERLTPGYSYYIFNNGTIAPFASIFELFTPNGNPFIVGTAISIGHLHLEPEVFDWL